MIYKSPKLFRKLSSILFLVFVFYFEVDGQSHSYKQKIATKILDRLFEVSAYPEIQKPKLVILGSKTLAANYVPSSNTIFIEDALYLICRSFGKDSLNALAFIIAHELTHAIFKDINLGLVPTSYLNYAGSFISNEREEQVADLQGSFLATISGYPSQQVLAGLIEKIYDIYHIEDKPKDAYPPKHIRIESAQSVLSQLENLLIVFENANWLVAKAEYELAQTLYDYILQYYRGLEIYNNRGIALVSQAMQYYNEETDIFVHPLELDLNSRLKKFNKTRGDLPPEDFQKRMLLLNKAKACFETAHKLSAEYAPAMIHLVSCYNLMNQPENAIKYFENNRLAIKNKKWNVSNSFQLKQAIGISFALQNNARAKTYFAKTFPELSSDLHSNAKYNLNLFQLKTKNDKLKQSLLQPFVCNWNSETTTGKLNLFNENHPVSKSIEISSGTNSLELVYKTDAERRIYLIRNKELPLLSIVRKIADSNTILEFQKMQRELDPVCQTQQQSSIGMFYSFEASNIVYILNKHGKITEQIQFLYN